MGSQKRAKKVSLIIWIAPSPNSRIEKLFVDEKKREWKKVVFERFQFFTRKCLNNKTQISTFSICLYSEKSNCRNLEKVWMINMMLKLNIKHVLFLHISLI